MDVMLSLLETRTLPGWPEATNPTLLENALIYLVVPVGVALLLTVVILGPRWSRTSEGEGVRHEGGPSLTHGEGATAIER